MILNLRIVSTRFLNFDDRLVLRLKHKPTDKTKKIYNRKYNYFISNSYQLIPNYNQRDAAFLDLFISTDALHVSDGFSAHHQEHITVHTASGIVNQYYCLLLSWTRFQITTNKMQHFLICLFLQTLYMFQTIPPHIIRNT